VVPGTLSCGRYTRYTVPQKTGPAPPTFNMTTLPVHNVY